MSRVILASASPRRRRLLAAAGVEFEVAEPEVEERTDGEPSALVSANALAKARDVASREGDDAIVLGSDTEVALGEQALGKPAGAEDARVLLRRLSGREHRVLSAVALVGPGGRELSEVVETLVCFRELGEEEIELYVRSREWRDRAGAYAIQGLGSMLAERVEGDLSSVIGLPVTTALRMLAAADAETRANPGA